MCPHADLDIITGVQIAIDFSRALEADTRARVVVGINAGVALKAVIPEQDSLVDVAGDFELDLAVALARCRRFKLGNALFQIRAAVASEVGCGGWRKAGDNKRANGAGQWPQSFPGLPVAMTLHVNESPILYAIRSLDLSVIGGSQGANPFRRLFKISALLAVLRHNSLRPIGR